MRKTLALLAVATALPLTLVTTAAAQADPVPPTITFAVPAGLTFIGVPVFPVQFCDVEDTLLPYTVDGIKGSPHIQYTLNISASPGALFGSAGLITKADNGVQGEAFWEGTVTNDTTVTFTATLFGPSPDGVTPGPVVATSAPVSEYVSCG